MKIPKRSVSGIDRSVNRRRFLAATGLLALVAPGAMAGTKMLPGLKMGKQVSAGKAAPEWWHARNALVLLAEGVVPANFVLPPLPETPDDTPSLEARLRVSYPISATKNLLAIQVFLVPADIPDLPWPVAPPLIPAEPNDPVTISYAEVRIDDIRFAVAPMPGTEDELPTFAISGEILSNDIQSPFGDLKGASCIVTAGFDTLDATTGETDFVMLGATVPGNHTSIAPAGQGTLRMKR